MHPDGVHRRRRRGSLELQRRHGRERRHNDLQLEFQLQQCKL
ncbi:hypothetical protein [Polyangium sorediatum]|uniref:Uncharacterized protein n=1 Tax=Polyangium sorediatum TaxID=889274 RepID=A0ABT6P2H8_9BACT|nr:hypothetical protein [Polyangium sorediatum]MDI1434567.1 hypothetical protein [Polyangium sorediatum]